MVFKLSSISGLGFLLLALSHPSWGKPGMNSGSGQCGQANQSGRRIVGGQETEKNEYPWQIVLYKDYGSYFWCGGSIISKREILTAAHCMFDWRGRIPTEELRVKVGDHNIKKGDGEIEFEVSSSKVHESYNGTVSLDYDFAILTLSRDIEFTKEVSPVCLPDSNGLDEHSQTVVSGWGTTSGNGRASDVLLDIEFTTMTNEVCKLNIRENGYSPSVITDRMLCGAAPGVSGCQGDSGGPWVTRDGNNNFVLIGVHSFTLSKGGDVCPKGEEFGAARVSDQLHWIRRNMQGATIPTLL